MDELRTLAKLILNMCGVSLLVLGVSLVVGVALVQPPEADALTEIRGVVRHVEARTKHDTFWIDVEADNQAGTRRLVVPLAGSLRERLATVSVADRVWALTPDSWLTSKPYLRSRSVCWNRPGGSQV